MKQPTINEQAKGRLLQKSEKKPIITIIGAEQPINPIRNYDLKKKKRIIPRDKDARVKITERVKFDVLQNIYDLSPGRLAKLHGISRSSVMLIQKGVEPKKKTRGTKKKNFAPVQRTEEERKKKAEYQKRYRDRLKLLKKGEL